MKASTELPANNSVGGMSGWTVSAHPGASRTLQNEAVQAQEVLHEADTVFPFILFPDTISVDRVKVTVTKRQFFFTAQIISIQIEDILNVGANTGPFFGSIKLWTRFFTEKPLAINYLSRHDAAEIKRILQGYIIARHKKIDTSNVPRGQLKPLLQQLGEDSSVHIQGPQGA